MSLFLLEVLGLCMISCTVKVVDAFQREGILFQTFLQITNDEVRVLETVLDVDILTCIENCQRRNVCQFINYHRLTHMCFLIEQLSGSVTEGNKISRAHFVFGQKSDWTEDYTPCGICSSRELCTIVEDGSITCDAAECPSPPVINNTLLLGNSYTVGNSLVYTCNNNSLATSGVVVCQTNGTWSSTDISCSSNTVTNDASQCDTGFIRFDDSCYYFSQNQETWTVAKEECQSLKGAYLAEVGDAAEDTFLGSIVQPLNADHWIGGSDAVVEGEWMWVTSDTTVTFIAWHPSQPSNTDQNEHCMELRPMLYWNDANCDDSQYYICERSIDN